MLKALEESIGFPFPENASCDLSCVIRIVDYFFVTWGNHVNTYYFVIRNVFKWQLHWLKSKNREKIRPLPLPCTRRT